MPQLPAFVVGGWRMKRRPPPHLRADTAQRAAKTKTPPKEEFVPTPPPPTKDAKRAIDRMATIEAIVARFDAKTLTELGRRARGAVRDGFPSSTGGGIHGSDVSRPTEASALVGLPPEAEPGQEAQPDDWSRRAPADPVGDAIDEVFALLSEALGLLMAADDQRGYILAVGKEGRPSSLASCGACSRDVLCQPDDRLRAGFCEACYKAWTRGGRVERTVFVRERRAELTEVA